MQIIWYGYITLLTKWLEKLKGVWQSLKYASDKPNNQRMYEQLTAQSTFWGSFRGTWGYLFMIFCNFLSFAK